MRWDLKLQAATIQLTSETMAPTHLFVDTNVFLDFYSYAKDDLGQLKRLTEHLKTGAVLLHLPQQVINEVERNRETKLKTSADQFKKESFPTSIPRHMQEYSHAKVYSEAVEAAFKARTAMINQAAAEAASRTLAADQALELLIQHATLYGDDDAVYGAATQRVQKGNPPGKSGSFGDQYNWECLLTNVAEEDLHIVSKDGDYASSLNPGKPHPFLEKEWREKKNARLQVYGSIRPFLDTYEMNKDAVSASSVPPDAPEIQPADEVAPPQQNAMNANIEIALAGVSANVTAGTITLTTTSQYLEKHQAIEALVNSYSFVGTHNAIAKLEEIRATLTKDDAEILLKAATENPQISRIASDSDVYSFYTALLIDHMDADFALWDAAAETFGMAPDPEDLVPGKE